MEAAAGTAFTVVGAGGRHSLGILLRITYPSLQRCPSPTAPLALFRFADSASTL